MKVISSILPFIIYILLLIALSLLIIQTANAQIGLKRQILSVVERNNVFNRIALCESGGDLRAKNKYSTASGEFQFTWGTWHRYGIELWGDDFYVKNIWSEDNRELAWYVYTKYGTRDWESSRSCWSKVSSRNT